MMTIIAALMPYLLKLLGMYFEGKEASKEQREAYINFITVMQKDARTPADLKESYDEQLRKLKELSENQTE